MKLSWRGIIGLVIPIALSSVAFAGENAPADGRSRFLDERHLNGIAAVVNERVITIGELRQEIAPILGAIESESPTERERSERAAVAFRDSLEDNIARALIIQDFESSGMKVPGVHKEFQIDEFIRNRFAGDRVLFTQQLRAYGKSLQQFKREMEEALIVGWALNRFHHSRAYVSPRQIREYYDDHRSDFVIPSAVRVGLVCLPEKVPSTPDPEEDKPENLVENPEISQIATRLKAGESFVSLAENLSSGSVPMVDEWLSLEDLRTELRVVAERMPIGSCSGKIRLPDGNAAFLYLYERHAEMLQPIEQVQGSIENIITQLHREADQSQWINGLRDKAYVGIYGQAR
ncbi:MAG: SurA N-terminal domain-containing protein [Puniceicoccales bacterium]|nr:SurA N-terminal domain-containing protein [Puniceicoccales bacterium]